MAQITLWLQQLPVGDESHLGELFEWCQPYLEGLARKKLDGTPGRTAAVQDVTQNVFLHVVKALRGGTFPPLTDRNHLFAMLTVITAGRVSNWKKSARAKKRGGGQVLSLDALGASDEGTAGPELLADSGPAPEQRAILRDLYQRYVEEELPDRLRACAKLHLAGYTQVEIAGKLGCVAETVARKMNRTREEWRRLAAQDGLAGEGQ